MRMFEDNNMYYLKMSISSEDLFWFCFLLGKVRYHMHQYIKMMLRLENEALELDMQEMMLPIKF